MIMNTKTSMSWLAMEQAKAASEQGKQLFVVREMKPNSEKVALMVAMIRDVRRTLRREGDIAYKYWLAGHARQEVRTLRDKCVISFDCCNALQRALDY